MPGAPGPIKANLPVGKITKIVPLNIDQNDIDCMMDAYSLGRTITRPQGASDAGHTDGTIVIKWQ